MENSNLNRSIKRMQHSVTNDNKQITDEADSSQSCVKQNQMVDYSTTNPDEISKFVYSYCTLKRNRRDNTKHFRTQSENIENLMTMGNVPAKSNEDSVTCEVLKDCDKTSFGNSDDIECLNDAEEDGYELLENSSDDNERYNNNTSCNIRKESELEQLTCDENINLMQEEHKTLELCLNDLDDYLENIDYNFHLKNTTIPRPQTHKVFTKTDITKYFTFPKIKCTNDIYLLNCSSSFRDVSKVTSIMDRIYKYDLTPIKMVNNDSLENKLLKRKRIMKARSLTLPKRAKKQILLKSLFSRSSFKRATISNVTKSNPSRSWYNDNNTTITPIINTNDCNVSGLLLISKINLYPNHFIFKLCYSSYSICCYCCNNCTETKFVVTLFNEETLSNKNS